MFKRKGAPTKIVPAPVALVTRELRPIQDAYCTRRRDHQPPGPALAAAYADVFSGEDLEQVTLYASGRMDHLYGDTPGARGFVAALLNSLEGLYHDTSRVERAIAYRPPNETPTEALVREALLRFALSDSRFAFMLDSPDEPHHGVTVELVDELMAKLDAIAVALHDEHPYLFSDPADVYRFFPNDGTGFIGPPAGSVTS